MRWIRIRRLFYASLIALLITIACVVIFVFAFEQIGYRGDEILLFFYTLVVFTAERIIPYFLCALANDLVIRKFFSKKEVPHTLKDMQITTGFVGVMLLFVGLYAWLAEPAPESLFEKAIALPVFILLGRVIYLKKFR